MENEGKEVNIKQLAEKLTQLVEGSRLESMKSALLRYSSGHRTVSEKFENRLLSITGAANRDELKKIFPKIQFTNEEVSRKMYNIEMLVIKKNGQANEAQLADAMRAMKALRVVGIGIKLVVTPSED